MKAVIKLTCKLKEFNNILSFLQLEIFTKY